MADFDLDSTLAALARAGVRKPRSTIPRRRPLAAAKAVDLLPLPSESSSSNIHSEVCSVSTGRKRPHSGPVGGVPEPEAKRVKPAESEASVVTSEGASNLVCDEQLSPESGDVDECELTLSDYESELLGVYSDEFYSDECFSSATSDSDDGEVSPAFQLLIDLAGEFEQFVDPETSAEAAASPNSSPLLLPVRRFEDDDDETSYELFRQRERRGELSFSRGKSTASKGFDSVAMNYRENMVNWMVEHSLAMQIQSETLFLSVSLMDRFLGRGCFKKLRNLELLGISCMTLATRIEENQPYNCIRQEAFKVGQHVYSRREVVAMEWLIQEVLEFQCYITTAYNFLWFYVKAANADERVEVLSRYMAVISLHDHSHLSFWPSTVAAAIVVLACVATNQRSSCHLVVETHIRTKNDDLPRCIKSLEWLIKFVC